MSLKHMNDTYLPMNRKERFFTGTVFPMIVCKDGNRHFHRFLDLLKDFKSIDVEFDPTKANIQFFTEYSLLESAIAPFDERFKDLPKTKDTPDIVILIEGEKRKILIALEAKMYANTIASSLKSQMDTQRIGLNCIIDAFDIAEEDTYHYALLPEKLALKMGDFDYPIITWDKIHEVFLPLGNDYWLEMLGLALDSYDDLVAKGAANFKKNCDALMTGLEIQKAAAAVEFAFKTVGRKGGLTGEELSSDIESGKWKSRQYELRVDKEPINGNWFLVTEFLGLVNGE